MEMSIRTIPLTDDELIEHFTNCTNVMYNISYENSSLKGEEFLTYLFNANIICDLSDETIDADLMEAYLKMNREISIPKLNHLIITSIIEDKKIISSEIVDELKIVLKSFHYNIIQLMNDKEPRSSDDYPEHIGYNWVSLRNDFLFWELVEMIIADDSLVAHAYNIFDKFAYPNNQNAYTKILSELNPYGLLFNVYKESEE